MNEGSLAMGADRFSRVLSSNVLNDFNFFFLDLVQINRTKTRFLKITRNIDDVKRNEET